MRQLFGAAALAAVLALPGQGEAQVTLGPTVAFHDDADFGIGAMVGVLAPSIGEGIGFLGDFTYFFPDLDNLDYWEINGNVTWDIPVEDRPVAPFVLGGLNLAQASVDGPTGDASDTEIGANFGGGIRFSAGSLQPLVGVRAELGGGEGVVIFAALPFLLGN